MSQNSLLRVARFCPDLLQSPSAWLGHLPFAAWVIQEVSPEIFVELGTHYGHSYFSFCQSVHEMGGGTKCYAVDTWYGDEHAGRYGDEIFNKVESYNKEHYEGFSRLLRMNFDDAAAYFSDESIGLLHIDGLHTYDAVLHDFITWLPKLAPGAVVLFHDINVRERDFGVWRLWEELQLRYPANLEFVHSHGLGVLQLNNSPSIHKLEWLQPNSPKKQQLVDYFSALGLRQTERYESIERERCVASLNGIVTERGERIASISKTLQKSEEQIASISQALKNSEEQIVSISQALAVRNEQVNALNQALVERENQIAAIKNSTSWRMTSPLRYIKERWCRR